MICNLKTDLNEETKITNNIQKSNIYTPIKKGAWSPEEDIILKEWVKKNGAQKWARCAEKLSGRNGKQCREHWNNCLKENILKGKWSEEEDFLIMTFYQKFKGSWRRIIPIFKNRTENSIKNRFYSQLRKIASRKKAPGQKVKNNKLGLDILLKYFNSALEEAKKNFIKYNPMNEKELTEYIMKIEKLNKNIVEGQDYIDLEDIKNEVGKKNNIIDINEEDINEKIEIKNQCDAFKENDIEVKKDINNINSNISVYNINDNLSNHNLKNDSIKFKNDCLYLNNSLFNQNNLFNNKENNNNLNNDNQENKNKNNFNNNHTININSNFNKDFYNNYINNCLNIINAINILINYLYNYYNYSKSFIENQLLTNKVTIPNIFNNNNIFLNNNLNLLSTNNPGNIFSNNIESINKNSNYIFSNLPNFFFNRNFPVLSKEKTNNNSGDKNN